MKKLFLVAIMAIWCSIPLIAKDDLKTNFRTGLVMAYSPANNMYEDENVKFEIYDERLWATNKTERTIFLDLSQCFLTHNGSSYPMFSKEQDEKKASKKKESTSIEEFISIAPSVGSKQNATFICNLAGIAGYGKYTTTESPSGDFSEYEERLLTLINEMVNESLDADPKGKDYIGTSYRHLTEDESVNNIGANIAYSFNKKSENWTPIAISTWVSDLYFAPYYVEMPEDLKKEKKRGFGVKKTEAAKVHIKADSPFEFDEEKSPLIVYDWTGNYKKGEFELNRTWIKKAKGMNLGLAIFASIATIATGGMGALLFTNLDETYYKRAIRFDGQNDDWGKMTYMKSSDLSQFNNNR